MGLPKTKIGDIEITRMILGSNTFHGFSHFSAARDNWLKQYFSREKTYELVERAAGADVLLGIAGTGGSRTDFAEGDTIVVSSVDGGVEIRGVER